MTKYRVWKSPKHEGFWCVAADWKKQKALGTPFIIAHTLDRALDRLHARLRNRAARAAEGEGRRAELRQAH